MARPRQLALTSCELPKHECHVPVLACDNLLQAPLHQDGHDQRLLHVVFVLHELCPSRAHVLVILQAFGGPSRGRVQVAHA